MGRHRPAHKSDPTATDLIAALLGPVDAPPIEITAVDPSGYPVRVRLAAGFAVAGLAASGLVGDADAAEADTPPATAEFPSLNVQPLTQEQAMIQLAAEVSMHAAQEVAQQQAADTQAAIEKAESDRRAAEQAAADKAAAEKAAAKEAARKAAAEKAAAEEIQEAAETATPSRSTPAPSQAAVDVTSTAAVAPSAGGVSSIVPGARITSGFGTRWGVLHAGVDLAAPLGSPIYTPMSGVVLKAGPASGFGNAVYIQVANGDVLVFGHMRTMFVSAGDTVSAGDKIALVGNEGQSTGPHCHVERHIGGINGQKVDPTRFLGL